MRTIAPFANAPAFIAKAISFSMVFCQP